jgi:hypothetical protein
VEQIVAVLALNYSEELNFFLFHTSLLLLCLNVASIKRAESKVTVAVLTFGGSTLAALLLGMTPFILTSKIAIPMFLASAVAVDFLPASLFAIPWVKWPLRIGTEVCRCAIATIWLGNSRRVLGGSRWTESVAIATISGSFGAVLATFSWRPIIASPTIGALFVAMLAYSLHVHPSKEEENAAKSLVVLWMLTAQYVLPPIWSSVRGLISGPVPNAKVESKQD